MIFASGKEGIGHFVQFWIFLKKFFKKFSKNSFLASLIYSAKLEANSRKEFLDSAEIGKRRYLVASLLNKPLLISETFLLSFLHSEAAFLSELFVSPLKIITAPFVPPIPKLLDPK